MRNFIYEGKSISIQPREIVKGGEPHIYNDVFGVVALDAAPNTSVELYIEGVYSLPKSRVVEIHLGKAVWWDPIEKSVKDKEEEGLKLIGIATRDAMKSDVVAEVKLMPALSLILSGSHKKRENTPVEWSSEIKNQPGLNLNEENIKDNDDLEEENEEKQE